MLFGPEQLPKVARKAGTLMREVQNTSQAFIREMERAADVPPAPPPTPSTMAGEAPHAAPYAYDFPVEPVVEAPVPAPADGAVCVDPYGPPPAPDPRAIDPYGEDPPVAERLAEPRPAIDREVASTAAQTAP